MGWAGMYRYAASLKRSRVWGLANEEIIPSVQSDEADSSSSALYRCICSPVPLVAGPDRGDQGLGTAWGDHIPSSPVIRVGRGLAADRQNLIGTR